MRWWLLLLLGLVVISIGLSVLRRPQPLTIGGELLAALDTAGVDGEKVREAIPLIDYTPPTPPAATSTDPDGPWRHGEEVMPGVDSAHSSTHRWIEGPGLRVSWWRMASDPTTNQLRNALAEDSEVRRRVRVAMGALENGFIDRTMNQAVSPLAAMTDEALFQAWLRADRTTLEEKDNWPDAVREALLLEARTERSPVVTFEWSNPAERIYLVGMPHNTWSSWLEMSTFEPAGKLVWMAVLRADGPGPGILPDPERVRVAAVKATALVTEEMRAQDSSRPGGP